MKKSTNDIFDCDSHLSNHAYGFSHKIRSKFHWVSDQQCPQKHCKLGNWDEVLVKNFLFLQNEEVYTYHCFFNYESQLIIHSYGLNLCIKIILTSIQYQKNIYSLKSLLFLQSLTMADYWLFPKFELRVIEECFWSIMIIIFYWFFPKFDPTIF